MAQQIARNTLEKKSDDPTGGAMYFHNLSVSPSWARTKRFLVQIGNHKFYK